MKANLIEQAYAVAKERYAAIGVDTDAVLDQLQKQQLSLHCWQTDDVVGFERNDALSGGIQTTGNYPGRARTIDEVRQDIEFVKTLLGGNHRLNLHEIYGDFGGQFVDRDQVEVKHFQSWIDWAKENNMKLDFNSTSFSHPKSGDLTLSNPDKEIRDFWIEHTKRCRRIADAMGKAQNDPCIMNIWVHDGMKDIPVQRKKYREILAASLDEIMEEKLDGVKNCFEAKLFGIGLESYTVGSHDFYTAYCSTRKQMYTLDTGHCFHPADVRARADAPREPPRTLGLRPRDDHERPDARPLQGARTQRRPRPCTRRSRLLRCLHQPHRCLHHRFARHTEVHPSGPARAEAEAARV